MTYEAFKRQLYHSLMELDTAEETEIGILEKGIEYQEDAAKRVIRAVNLSDHGKEEGRLQADLLYAILEKGGYDCMLYWPMRQYYERYKAEGWQGVLPELAAAISRERREKNALPAPGNTYVQSRANLILRPFSAERFRAEACDGVYWEMGDIVLALYLLVYEDSENYITMKLERGITGNWGKRDDVLLTGALLNCFSRMPPRLYPAQDELIYYDEKGGVFMPGEEGIPAVIDLRDPLQGILGYRLTTTRRLNGAIAIFYPGVRERLAQLLKDDFYVIFSCVNEVLIFPVRRKHLSELREEVLHRVALLEAKARLSEKIYRYVQVRGELMEV
ncbi:MAG: hypothetical protein J5898_04510 [Lachnospiraceae bacterium]|nr:hypothetical protein [Lachnospiraceae bacterium]